MSLYCPHHTMLDASLAVQEQYVDRDCLSARTIGLLTPRLMSNTTYVPNVPAVDYSLESSCLREVSFVPSCWRMRTAEDSFQAVHDSATHSTLRHRRSVGAIGSRATVSIGKNPNVVDRSGLREVVRHQLTNHIWCFTEARLGLQVVLNVTCALGKPTLKVRTFREHSNKALQLVMNKHRLCNIPPASVRAQILSW